jgi:hypothetical protein
MTISGQGVQNGLVDATAIAAGLDPGPDAGTGCGHDANCLFRSARSVLHSYASPACSESSETFSRGGGSPNQAGAYIAASMALFGGQITGNFVDILNLYFNSLWPNVNITVQQVITLPAKKK